MELTFPPISPFLELVQQAEQKTDKIIIRDHSSGVAATARQLLTAVSHFREKVQSALGQDGKHDFRSVNDERFIFLLAPPGWEYVVSMLTTLSVGAGFSAQSIAIRPEEMKRYFKLGNPLALLYASDFTEKVNNIKTMCAETDSGINPNICFLEIQAPYHDDLSSYRYKLESFIELGPSRPGSLFFTSGTSGNQKGVVHSYQALLASAQERIKTWKLTDKDIILNQKPGNWMGGIFVILPSLMSGACLEPCAGIFDPQWFWERIGEGGVSIFDIAATGYDRLAQYFDEYIAVHPPHLKEKYIQGMVEARVASVSGSLLPPRTQKRWTEIRRGRPLLNLYGSTEATIICSMRWEDATYPDMCSVGPAVPGVEVKLVDGEIRLKAPTMFSRYISDDLIQTERAFDSEGFFKTGDCAQKVGNCYKLYGRANIDVLHFWGFTLHTSEIEAALLSLPYITKAVVFPLEDEERQTLAAAILELDYSHKTTPPNLQTLRNDTTAHTGLMLLKQPTVIYWLQVGEEIALTTNGKISKITARNKFFGDKWWHNDKVEVLDLKTLQYWRMGGQC